VWWACTIPAMDADPIESGFNRNGYPLGQRGGMLARSGPPRALCCNSRQRHAVHATVVLADLSALLASLPSTSGELRGNGGWQPTATRPSRPDAFRGAVVRIAPDGTLYTGRRTFYGGAVSGSIVNAWRWDSSNQRCARAPVEAYTCATDPRAQPVAARLLHCSQPQRESRCVSCACLL
jgi:hypothetical protein